MSITRQIPRTEWNTYFDRFTRQHLGESPPEAVTIELVSPQAGDQFETTTVRLLGLAYDVKSQALQVLTEDLDHLVHSPSEIWVVEEEGGFISTIKVAQPDGSTELLHIERSGPLAPQYDQPGPGI
jgi:hypothetical protein